METKRQNNTFYDTRLEELFYILIFLTHVISLSVFYKNNLHKF